LPDRSSRACARVIGLALADAVLVHAEQAHHEAGGAEAALRPVAPDHGLLRRVQAAVGAGEVFDGPQRQAVDRVGQADAAVDRAVLQPVGRGLAQHDGAGAAVAFTAALLGAGAGQVLAQQVEQGAVGRDIAQRDNLAAADESDGPGTSCLVSLQRGWLRALG
jgi:hypothetical protein